MTARRVSLQLIKTKHEKSPLRTEKIVGTEASEPQVGESYTVYAPPLDPDMIVRQVRTSTVQRIEQGEGFLLLETLNSTYKVDIL